MTQGERTVQWYFDFISPYSYFSLLRLAALDEGIRVVCKPILFAGLLGHWGHKGPAEIPSKRVWTYRSCVWWAKREGLPFRFPAAHPFNSLPYLRLAIAAGSTLEAVTEIFRRLWTTGVAPSDPAVLADLARTLGVDPERLSEPAIKGALRSQTDEAIERGLFGVPTLVIDDELFWGSDGIDFALEYLAEPAILDDGELRRVSTLPIGVARQTG
jgi:2-hydroxychromene-2-carboxylate isomerase